MASAHEDAGYIPGFLKETCKKNGDFLGGSESTESTCNAGDLGLIPGLRRSQECKGSSSMSYLKETFSFLF